MKRSITALGLAAVLCTASAGGMKLHAAAESVTGHLTYEIRDNRTVTITDFDNEVSSVTIPRTIEGLSVTEIGNEAFRDAVMLQSITIPNTVTTIGQDAFNKCTGLVTLDIPDSVTAIGKGAFASCISLEEVGLPEGISKIEDSLFAGCVSLLEIEIPDTVLTMEGSAFSGCSSLVNACLGKNMSSIAADAFKNCTSLSVITVPIGITDLGKGGFLGYGSAFSGCSISEVYYAGSPIQWSAMGGITSSFENATIHYGASNPVLKGSTPAGDVDGDNAINAVDASYILQFAAYQGNGGDQEFSVFVRICIEGGSL